ncbi:PREDICTED: V-type proton ATPase 116 kDa subunit a isoform 1-like [Priapulus caudatus]|uniref:V-type proton ATPase subunit a n=1 Tax=Priapulus caudatus TaxID=37621 RepID=A0ABM1EA11_PRICU|nr:PREDICTED: V-type proton ATPase 116 kDa subunit a isoform 1-like [Priapulus caudatus]
MLDTGDNPDAPAPREMIDLEATFEKLENEMKEVNTNAEALKRNFLELTELKHILRKTQVFFDEAAFLQSAQMHDQPKSEEAQNLLGEEATRAGGQPLKLGFVAGVILRERIPAFERLLWRACRGNVYLKFADIETPLEDPVTGDQVNKCVFIIFYQGEQLKSRVKKICEGFRATLYPCPETPAERREMAIGVMTRIEDLQTVLGQTQDHRHRVLVAAAKNIKVWFIKVQKIKAIYHTLNLFNLDVTQKCLIAECWCPVEELEKIQLALRRGTERSGSNAPCILNQMTTNESPPTYNHTNKFTVAFQTLVDSYGVASYREVNPAPFTIISFPFLFAVMFGDTGHAMLMLAFGGWMVIKEKSLLAQKSTNEIWNTFFGGRYIILLMALFSLYTGLIYNDFYSKSVNLFGSAWHSNYTEHEIHSHKQLQMCPNSGPCIGPDHEEIPSNYRGYPYPFGLDPIWMISVNTITYTNSFKMKMSVIIGVCQMLFGVFLSIFNHRFFKEPMNIFAKFIPELVFLNAIFGYLCVLIIAKWISWGGDNAACAPSILLGLINMFLFKYDSEENDSCESMFAGQQGLQVVLVLVAVISAICLLLLKPLLMLYRHRLKHPQVARLDAGGHSDPYGEDHADGVEHHDTQPLPSAGGASNEEEEFDFGELFVHQCIHTIEFCLGCVSHTASYLRLWALSLAHGQLSEVLWSMVLRNGFAINGMVGSIVLFAVFAPWLMLTIGILLVMEGLSAFLHTLRLHWVEFQSKFYVGSGYPFTPFSFEIILDQAEASDHEVH